MTPDEHEVALRLGRQLRAIRERRGLSQAEMAELLELTPTYLGELERGEKLPALGTLARVAAVLGATFDQLLLADRRIDPWADEALALLRALPEALRPMVIAMLRAGVREPLYPRRPSRLRRP